MIKNNKKRGLSPVVTTVLLIALVVVIIMIIFLWFRGMVEEGVIKFGENIQLVCDDVEFESSYSNGELSIVNTGNVPIFNLNVKISQGGNYQTKEIAEVDGGENWPENGLNQGASFSGNIGNEVESADKIVLYPILMGSSSSGKKTYICEGSYGKEIKL